MKRWPIDSTIAIIVALLILAAEYVYFTFTAIDVMPSPYEPALSKVEMSPVLPNDLEWHENSALSPDGSKIVRVVDLPSSKSLRPIPRLVVESASTHQELAHLVINFPCGLYLDSGCHIQKVSWLNNSKIAFEDAKAGTRVWEWKSSRPIAQTTSAIEVVPLVGLTLFGLPLGLINWAVVHGIRSTRQNEALRESA